MPRRIWETTKAVLALIALVGAALVSADRLDRRPPESRPGEPRHAAAMPDPATTGALGRPPAP